MMEAPNEQEDDILPVFESNKLEPVPYIVHEAAMARMERTSKRLWILIIMLVVLLFGSNAAWIWYESQWEVVETTEVTQDADGNGNNSFIGGNFYGTTDSETNEAPHT